MSKGVKTTNTVAFKKMLIDKHISQNELARRMNIDIKTLSNKVTGKTDFKLSEVKHICKELEIDDPRPVFFS